MEVTRGDDQHVRNHAPVGQVSSGSLNSTTTNQHHHHHQHGHGHSLSNGNNHHHPQHSHSHSHHRTSSTTTTTNIALSTPPPPAVIPTLSREFVARRISEGETGRLKEELKCQACGKGYKHISSLAKHLWEHTPEWNMTSRLLISKHQQVQLLEAASILVSMTEEEKAAMAALKEEVMKQDEAAGKGPDDSQGTYSPITTDSTASTGSRTFTSGSASDNSPSPPPATLNTTTTTTTSTTDSTKIQHYHHHHHHHHYHSHAPGSVSSSTAGITKGPTTARRPSLSYNPPSSASRRFSSGLASRSAVADLLLDAVPLGSPRSFGTVVPSSVGNTAIDDYEALQSPYNRPRKMSNVRAPGPALRQQDDSGSSPPSMEDDNDADDEDNKQEFSVFGDMDD